ncbi:mechanosensitive ion channel domain-containing protein [Erythrobacter sp. SG61-1L]|uniref:mechanosensitive ion channel family protein n=1 Tax=Erythrobacter sp. SG61-1L TaxID=1603897 RepID=UPI0006C93393|nr:mechanosensitive ion channel domain-containing protein [Erythrobacter sp. SG61-1L]
MSRILTGLPFWLQPVAIVVLALFAAFLLHWALFAVLGRAVRHSEWGASDIAMRGLRKSARWVMLALAVSLVQPALPLPPETAVIWRQIERLVVPALFGWLVIAVIGWAFSIVQARTDISAPDNLSARRRSTRAHILYRVLVFVIALGTFCIILMGIPAVRNVGVTLIASAGLAGLAVGAAAQPALKNLVAGIQMAFTEPIRMDDVVIIDGEWGRIEEIRLTFVIIRIWDERRLVVPISRFLEDSFQNWTRTTSQILGTAFLHVDPATDVPQLRAKLQEIVAANDKWDGRVVGLQVTETAPDHIELRALVSAADAGKAFDLRCDVREAMMAYIRDEMPDALMRKRGEFLLDRRRGDKGEMQMYSPTC